MYKIKEFPEDFIVKEKMQLNFFENGSYSYYIMSKKNYTTTKAIEIISKKFNIKPKLINSAGLKDKQALTSQYISIFKGPPKNYQFEDISLEYIGMGKERINVGSLDGNHFIITLRDVTKAPEPLEYVPNFFDSQRFGKDCNNHIIGKHLVKNEFSKAAEMLVNDKLRDYLQKNPNDFIGALRKIPKRELQFLVSAYQSALWNKAIEQYLKTAPKKDSEFPVPGFNVEIKDDQKEIYFDILKQEGLKPRDFINRSFPELSCDGYQRKVFTHIHDLEIGKLEPDKLYHNYKIRLSFFLEKGNYATNVVKYLFRANQE